ncbi:DNA-3-methyladenine glycosylase family protein [Streptomyces sp. NPDC057694]|uniref:DNA-3-methyladenine glycosylase family protein n=1 Tax=Streptomyces sp. NPDC057694 TaxID=3346216 RepID=UPI00368184C0
MAGRRYIPHPQAPTRTTVRGGAQGIPAPATPPLPATESTRTYTPRTPLHLGLTLGPLRRGPADPTFRSTPDGALWRASRTPEGPATLRVTSAPDGTVRADSWGPGAPWFLDHLPALLGEQDDAAPFEPRHRLVAESARRRAGLRLTRTGLVLESLIPSILEQKITTDEAYRAWRLLLHKFGEPAPGPAGGDDLRMRIPPDPYTWTRIPSWEWHKAGVDNKRASTIIRAAQVARRLEEAATMEPPAARARLELVPGIGPWTSAETIQRTNGAPDEVTTGDLHLPGIVGYALAGNRHATDTDMLELLTPYTGQRHRAARLILLSGVSPPRRHPKMRRVNIAEW